MTRRLPSGLLASAVAALLLAGCGYADGAGRAETRLAQYRHDPLTSPVDIGLTLSDPPDPEPRERTGAHTPPPGRPGQDDLRLVYWFEVPEGSDRDVLLELAATKLVERGWDLIVATNDVRMLTTSPGTDDLRATIIMPAPDSDHIVQEIRIRH